MVEYYVEFVVPTVIAVTVEAGNRDEAIEKAIAAEWKYLHDDEWATHDREDIDIVQCFRLEEDEG